MKRLGSCTLDAGGQRREASVVQVTHSFPAVGKPAFIIQRSVSVLHHTYTLTTVGGEGEAVARVVSHVHGSLRFVCTRVLPNVWERINT
jgi:hypothetical protein